AHITESAIDLLRRAVRSRAGGVGEDATILDREQLRPEPVLRVSAHAVRAAAEESLLRMQPESGTGRPDGARPSGTHTGGNNHAAERVVVAGDLAEQTHVIELRARLQRCILAVEPEDVARRRREDAVRPVESDGDRERREPVRRAEDVD